VDAFVLPAPLTRRSGCKQRRNVKDPVYGYVSARAAIGTSPEDAARDCGGLTVEVSSTEKPLHPDERRDRITLLAVEPKDATLTCEVLISYARMQVVGRRSLGHAKECGIIVPAVLQTPTSIFEGLRRDEDEDRWGYGWRCYCGLPEQAFLADVTKIPPYRGQVYVVFLNDERVAYNWRWEKADPDDIRLPVDHETRFKQRLL